MKMMYNNQMFNQNYVNLNQSRTVSQQEQDKAVEHIVRAIHDMCKAAKILDSQHQQKAFRLGLTKIVVELWGDNNVKFKRIWKMCQYLMEVIYEFK